MLWAFRFYSVFILNGLVMSETRLAANWSSLLLRIPFQRSGLPLGFHITPEHWDSQPASPECASQSLLSVKIVPSLRQSSLHTSFPKQLVGGTERVLVVVTSHQVQIQQIWTGHLLDPREVLHVSSPSLSLKQMVL